MTNDLQRPRAVCPVCGRMGHMKHTHAVDWCEACTCASWRPGWSRQAQLHAWTLDIRARLLRGLPVNDTTAHICAAHMEEVQR